MAAVRIALAMYYDKDIEKILQSEVNPPIRHSCSHRVQHELWKQIEMKAVDKLSFLPDLLKVRVSKLLRPIHKEAWRWTLDNKNLLKLSSTNCYLTYKNILCWKTDETIDILQTAKKLVRDKNINNHMRFEVACTYFLEEEVLALWYEDNEVYAMSMLPSSSKGAVQFWVKYLEKGSWRKKSWKAMIKRFFKIPSRAISKVPLRVSCFFPYLSWEGKKNYFIFIQGFDSHADDFLLCVQAMDERERIELLSSHPVTSLRCCLKSPFQFVFMEMANQLWNHMDTVQFIGVLDSITMEYLLDGFEDFDYVGLLNEFWDIIPATSKEEIKKEKKFYRVIEAVLNCGKENASPSLPETLKGVCG